MSSVKGWVEVIPMFTSVVIPGLEITLSPETILAPFLQSLRIDNDIVPPPSTEKVV